MENYDELVMKNQSGMIDDLEFLLEQEKLVEAYVAEMQEKGLTPNAENAAEWLRNYELTHIYQ
ncbi:hypothetical protein [Bacteroides ovatus]|uniref:hypothetical protein n=1 Tax=Bacteroides ovatus TaxID=28116 RepID=UPI00202E3B09|nr:hypothetical protein [Bacteroides ovatus]MCM1722583.1 hypothetical protein [Bacteroides ovatus]MCM1757690.1 hypothetical protein [Bacteroides ovatus]MCM1868698.1 hypothetical protein [Bacteroides ovatus]MCM1910937.1 hypothetical protein [Bacteroides ovatus]